MNTNPPPPPLKQPPRTQIPGLVPVLTLREVGERMGLPFQNVARIEKRALGKLRKRLAHLGD